MSEDLHRRAKAKAALEGVTLSDLALRALQKELWCVAVHVGPPGESPGLIMLSPTHRHGSVLTEVVGEVPLLAGNLMDDTETAVLMREHGVRRICTLVSDS